jgi:hypothetical protein
VSNEAVEFHSCDKSNYDVCKRTSDDKAADEKMSSRNRHTSTLFAPRQSAD